MSLFGSSFTPVPSANSASGLPHRGAVPVTIVVIVIVVAAGLVALGHQPESVVTLLTGASAVAGQLLQYLRGNAD